MPDFCSRPDGRSKSLKDAYVNLRRRGFSDRNIYIYPQGEFSKFKGDILEQQPDAGEMVQEDTIVTLIAAVPGISHILPDLFTDQMSDFFSDDKSPRHGAKNLFSIFDSMFLKMRCRLEWIRDIYAGVYHSPQFVEYLNSIFFVTDTKPDRSDLLNLGFILSRLSRFKGTGGAIQVLLESLTGLRVSAEIKGNRRIPIPENSSNGLGDAARLGENLILGDTFESEKPELSFRFGLEGSQDVPKIIEFCRNQRVLDNVRERAMPYYLRELKIGVAPDSTGIDFICGNSYLGFSTTVNSNGSELD